MTDICYPFLCEHPDGPDVAVHLADVAGVRELIQRWAAPSPPPFKVNGEGMAVVNVQPKAVGVNHVVDLTLRSYCKLLQLPFTG